jgi:SAM-dependent methyltransferase
MKEFYELDSRRRCAGSKIAQTHTLSLEIMGIDREDVVLEVGCGGGALLSKITMTGSVAVGLDISETQIKHTKTHLQDALLIVGVSERLPLKDNVFTKCFAVEIIEHVQNPGQIMKEIRRVLKDNGELIIVVPNDKNWFIYRILQGHFRAAFYDYGHLYDFSSIGKLEPFLKGFKVLMLRETNVPTIPILGIIDQLLRGFNKILKRQEANVISTRKDHENAYTRLLTYNNRFSPIAPKLTLHLIIKLKKNDGANARILKEES